MVYKFFTFSFLLFALNYPNLSGNNQVRTGNGEKKYDLFQIGYTYFKNNDLTAAKLCFIKAKAAYAVSDNYTKVAECLYYLSDIAFKENRFTEACELLDQQSKLAEKHKINHSLVWEGKYLRGTILFKEKKIAEAYVFFNQLTALLNRYCFVDSTLAKIYHQKGTVEYYKGDFYNSLKSYDESVVHGTAAFGATSLFVSDQINNLGVINYMLDRFDEALRYYKKSENILHLAKNPDKKALAATYANIGLVFMNKNDLPNAQLFNEKARDLYLLDPKHGDGYIANAYLNLAVIYYRLNSNDLQLACINEALKYSEKSNPYLLPKIYLQLAYYYEKTNQLYRAQKYFSLAITKAKTIFGESSDLAYAHNNLGLFFINHNINVNKALQHFEASRDFFLKTVGFKNSSLASCYMHIGDYYNKTGQPEKALKTYHTALLCITENFDNTDPFTFSYDTKSLANDYSIEILKDKACMLEKLSNKTFDKKQKLFYLQSAFFHYKQAIRYIELIRSNYFGEESRLLLGENEQNTFFQAIRIAYNLYQITGNSYYKDNAFIIADNAHSGSLQTMIREKVISLGDRLKYPLLNREMSLKRELSSYNEWINREKSSSKPDSARLRFWKSKVTEIAFKIEEVKNEINEEHPAYKYLSQVENNFHNVADIQEKLGNNESIIEYLLSDSVMYSFCITKKQSDMRRIPINNGFFGDIDKVLDFVKYPTVNASDSLICQGYRKSGYHLYEILIEPYRNLIRNKSLIIVPDGKLTYLPFCTLLTAPTENKTLNYKELPYLVKQFPVRYIYYASGLLNTIEKTHASKLMLAIAPSYHNNGGAALMDNNMAQEGEMGSLFYNQKEVESVIDLVGGKAFLGDNASEEVLKKNAPDYRIIHLAMHATVNDDDPLNSKLFFTPHSSKMEDDFLYGYETYNLKLNTDLLVLSACNTGTGKLRKGEGIQSLTRGFVFAGVKSIVMTLWAVNDKAGFLIMERFYRNITRQNSKDRALQQSKIDYIRSSDIIHAHPYYWAGYVLIGDNTPIDCSKNRLWYLGALGGFILLVFGIWVYWLKRK
jgi:CHAT domain-containing protein